METDNSLSEVKTEIAGIRRRADRPIWVAALAFVATGAVPAVFRYAG